MRQYVVERIFSWQRSGDQAVVTCLELGVGNGDLATSVLERLQPAVDDLAYVGADINDELMSAALDRLRQAVPECAVRACLVDLNDPAMLGHLASVNVIFSLQSLHDLDGYQALSTVYETLFQLLSPGGLLVNADFIVPFPQDDPDRPRRFPVEVHQDLLARLGFTHFTSQVSGKLACMTARR